MPQLDSTIIFTQLFWLILIFSFLYGCFLFFILPTIVKTLKLRNVLIQLQNVARDVTDSHRSRLLDSSLKNLRNSLQLCESQNLGKVKSFVQKDFKNVGSQNSIFLKRLHGLLIYNLIK